MPAPALTRPALNSAELEQALQTCASEAIHIPGAIQPFGILLVVNPQTGRVMQASSNAERMLGVPFERLPGQLLSTVIGTGAAQMLAGLQPAEFMRAGQRSTRITVNGIPCDAVIHDSDGQWLLELEPVAADPDAPDALVSWNTLHGDVHSLAAAPDMGTLYEMLVNRIRSLTGFERVMLYRFDADWHGWVVAESRVNDIESYLGLHFPESDIPAQARALYAISPIRLIADTRYQPASLWPEHNPLTGKPVDLRHAMLRSVSPVHLEYLENMGVRASMSLSVMQQDRLWGLVACHHRQPRQVPLQQRIVAEMLCQAFSGRLAALLEAQRMQRAALREALLGEIPQLRHPSYKVVQVISSLFGLATRAVQADGMALVTGSQIQKYGRTPDDAGICQIVGWLTATRPNTVFHTDDLSASMPDLSPQLGGVLATPLGSLNHDFILWFREPVRQLVNWAGRPSKSVHQGPAGVRLSPRDSFERWEQEVNTRSTPWASEDVETANRILQVILESAKVEAEVANAAKSEFLARMSHELRTPMNAILGIVAILERSFLSEQQKDYLRTLRLSSDSLLSLINDLLDISRIESREFHLDEQPVSLLDIARDVIQLLDIQARNRGLELILDADADDALRAMGDPHRIRQIMLNLVGNALKFTERGQVALKLRRVYEYSRTVQFVITVTDTGIGIPAGQHDRIFEPFVQADTGITRRYGGTGLGLSICRQLVEQMHGCIRLDSAPGQGSAFTVILPLKPATEPEPSLPTTSSGNGTAVRPAQPLRLLLVEDYEGNIIVAVTLLQGIGYAVEVARNGQDALERLQTERFDAVLMDVQMPVMDGYAATRQWREIEVNEKRGHLPILGMTAHALAGDREKCLAAGMDDYVAKPFQLDALEQKLQRLLAAGASKMPDDQD